ncbi:TPA: hypothetical protein G9F26_003957 [Salmonella enterica]|uniref:Uncharacterized protein n=1 Tax=Salmonella enterica TaxID=28901 RepID=A0A750MUC9_SALER|nr:hypothetical protein [Salmonella enterica]
MKSSLISKINFNIKLILNSIRLKVSILILLSLMIISFDSFSSPIGTDYDCLKKPVLSLNVNTFHIYGNFYAPYDFGEYSCIYKYTWLNDGSFYLISGSFPVNSNKYGVLSLFPKVGLFEPVSSKIFMDFFGLGFSRPPEPILIEITGGASDIDNPISAPTTGEFPSVPTPLNFSPVGHYQEFVDLVRHFYSSSFPVGGRYTLSKVHVRYKNAFGEQEHVTREYFLTKDERGLPVVCHSSPGLMGPRPFYLSTFEFNPLYDPSLNSSNHGFSFYGVTVLNLSHVYEYEFLEDLCFSSSYSSELSTYYYYYSSDDSSSDSESSSVSSGGSVGSSSGSDNFGGSSSGASSGYSFDGSSSGSDNSGGSSSGSGIFGGSSGGSGGFFSGSDNSGGSSGGSGGFSSGSDNSGGSSSGSGISGGSSGGFGGFSSGSDNSGDSSSGVLPGDSSGGSSSGTGVVIINSGGGSGFGSSDSSSSDSESSSDSSGGSVHGTDGGHGSDGSGQGGGNTDGDGDALLNEVKSFHNDFNASREGMSEGVNYNSYENQFGSSLSGAGDAVAGETQSLWDLGIESISNMLPDITSLIPDIKTSFDLPAQFTSQGRCVPVVFDFDIALVGIPDYHFHAEGTQVCLLFDKYIRPVLNFIMVILTFFTVKRLLVRSAEFLTDKR